MKEGALLHDTCGKSMGYAQRKVSRGLAKTHRDFSSKSKVRFNSFIQPNFFFSNWECSLCSLHKWVAYCGRKHPTTSSLNHCIIFFTSLRPLVNFAAGSALGLKPSFKLQPRLAVTTTQYQKRSYAKRKMPPKKAVKEEKILLGRPGNNLKSGIVCRATFPCKDNKRLTCWLGRSG